MLIEIYTDGSATIATKPGGYGWVMVIDGKIHSEGNGHMTSATNNDAEMEAAIQGMAAVVRHLMANPEIKAEIHLRSDSQIVLNWADGTSSFKQKAKELKYHQLRSLYKRLGAKTRWVEGHSGHKHNDRCDELANLGRHNLTADQELPKKAKARKATVARINKIGKRTDSVICLLYRNNLKLVDLANNIVENYNPTLHGERIPTTANVPLDLGDI